MPTNIPVPTKNVGDVFTSAMWNSYIRDNINKLLNQQHRKVTVAQFAAIVSPEEGDEVYLEVDSTNGIEWHLVYRAAEPTNHWRFLGGPPLSSSVLTGEATATVFPVDLTTVGPSITTPRGGDYGVEEGVRINLNNTGAAVGPYSAEAGLKIGAAAATIDLYQKDYMASTDLNGEMSYMQKGISPVTNDVLKLQYGAEAGILKSNAYSNRYLYLLPRRIN